MSSEVTRASPPASPAGGEAVAWTNASQLGFLKEFPHTPMAMWAAPCPSADIPLYRSSAAPAQSNGDEGRGLPLCCVTGRIAGDGFACGDCDPCGAAHAVPQSVKTLLEERDHFADKYSEAACECDTLRARLAKATTALRESLTENAWNAYYCGVTKEGGKWMDGGRSEGEWLRRELGLSDGWHDCAMIQNRIPEVVEKQIAALKDIQS